MADLRVLVVEDPPSIAQLMAAVLDDVSCTTTVCSSLEHALTTAKAMPPQVIIADLLMDGSDGTAFYAALRNSGVDCPVILCSAWREAPGVAADLGLRFISQPFEIDELVAAVTDAATAFAVGSLRVPA